MNKELKINLNDTVKVKLTEEGLKIHKQNYETLFKGTKWVYEYKPPKTDKYGWSKWQLHELMYQFGHYCSVGVPQLPFSTEMIYVSTGVIDERSNTATGSAE